MPIKELGRERFEQVIKGPWLYQWDEPIFWRDAYTNITRGGAYWISETLYRNREIVTMGEAMGDAFREGSFLGLANHIGRGAGFGAEFFTAGRMANGLRQAIVEHNQKPNEVSRFGIDAWRARNHPLLPHGQEHARRVEYWQRAISKNVAPIRHKNTIVEELRALAVTPYGHDEAQNLWELANFEKAVGDEEIPVKLGHEWVGALYRMMLSYRYAREHDLDPEEAKRDCYAAAAIILPHNEPEKFSRRRRATLALSNRTGPKEIHAAWKESELDVLSLTPAQIYKVARWVRRTDDVLRRHPEWMFHPTVEEEYAWELAELRHDHKPLKDYIRERNREPVWLAAEVLVRGDTLDMVTPYFLAVLRTFMTQWSVGRPLFRESLGEETALALAHGEHGNIDQAYDDDTRRKLWEYLHFHDIEPESVIGKSDYIRRVNTDNVFLGILAFRRLGQEILAGNFSSIDEIYSRRAEEVRQKALRRKVFDDGRYGQKLEQLEREKALLKSVLAAKVCPTAVDSYTRVVDGVIATLRSRHDVSEKQLREYEEIVRTWGIPRTQPYKSGDSLGDKPATLKQLRPFAEQVIDGQMGLR